jgi:ribokinase
MVDHRIDSPVAGAAGTTPRAEVIVAGSLHQDLVLRVSRLPASGQTIHALGQSRGPGGKGLNQAIAAALDGARVRMIGCVGDDASGHELLATLAAHGIECRGVRTDHREDTGRATVCVDEAGENLIVVVPGANHLLGTDDLDGMDFGPTDVLVGQGEIRIGVTEHFLAQGCAAGATTILNLAPFVEPSAALLASTSILVVNDAELLDLAGWCVGDVGHLDGPGVVQAVSGMLEAGPTALVLTLGSAGAVLITAEGIVAVPGHRVDVQDTTGAGDAFTGVLAAEVALGTDLATAVVKANDAASLVVQRRGSADVMPSRAEIQAVGAPA